MQHSATCSANTCRIISFCLVWFHWVVGKSFLEELSRRDRFKRPENATLDFSYGSAVHRGWAGASAQDVRREVIKGS